MPKTKRKLSDKEVKEIREWKAKENPTLRQIAKAYGVNRPSVVKSLGREPLLDYSGGSPLELKTYTTK